MTPEAVFFWYQITDTDGLDELGLPVVLNPLEGIVEDSSGLFTIGPASLGPPKETYKAYLDVAHVSGRGPYVFQGASAAGNPSFDTVDPDQTPEGWNHEGLVDVVQVAEKNVVRLAEGSNASISQQLNMGKDVREVRFEFSFKDVSEGDKLQVLLDGVVLWQIDALNYPGDESYLSPVIGLPPGYDSNMRLAIQLFGSTEPGGQAYIDNVFVGLVSQLLAEAGGPYRIDPGDSLTLDASWSISRDYPITAYKWDLDWDWIFETDAGNQAIFILDFAYLESLGLGLPGQHGIRLWVADSTGYAAIDCTTLTTTPAPGALLLGTMGLSLAGWLLRHRRT